MISDTRPGIWRTEHGFFGHTEQDRQELFEWAAMQIGWERGRYGWRDPETGVSRQALSLSSWVGLGEAVAHVAKYRWVLHLVAFAPMPAEMPTRRGSRLVVIKDYHSGGEIAEGYHSELVGVAAWLAVREAYAQTGKPDAVQ